MLSTEVMLYLDDQLDFIDLDLTGTSGNLFDNAMPPNPDIAFMVENTGGSPQSFTTKTIQEPSLRILVRGKADPRVPRKYARKIIDLIGSFRKGCFIEFGPLEFSEATWEDTFILNNKWSEYNLIESWIDVHYGIWGTWNKDTTYQPKTVIEYNNRIYVALQENMGVEPGVDSSWEDYWQELEGTFVHSCQAVQPRPVNIGRDENDRFRFSTNFELKIGVK